MTVISSIIADLNNRFPVGTNEYADLVKILLTKNLEKEEQQRRDDFNAGYRFAKDNGQDFEEYINHLKAK